MLILQITAMVVLILLGFLALLFGLIRFASAIRKFKEETPSTSDSSGSKHETKRISKGIVWVAVILFYVLLETLAFLLRGQELKMGDSTLSWSWFFGLMPVFHFLLSLRSVGIEELGATSFFGQPIEEVDPGLVLVPFPFVKLHHDPRGIIQMEIPGEPEEVQKEDEDRIEPGKKAPVRIIHSPPETAVFYVENGSTGKFTTKNWASFDSKEQTAIKEDPLNRRLATEVSTILRLRIRPGEYIQFIQVIGDLDKARKQLEDAVVSAEQSELGKVTASHAVIRKSYISELIKRAVEIRTGEIPRPEDGKFNLSWGVDVETVEIKLIDTGETVNRAVAAASAAGFRKHETITTAEGERQKRILEGEGLAKARQLLLEAEAVGAAKLAEVAGTDAGKMALALETMRDALKGANYSIVPSEGFLGAVSALQETLGKVKSPPSRIAVVDR